METLKILRKDDDLYEFESLTKEKYELKIEFWDIEEKPDIGDTLYINSNLLNPNYEGYSSRYIFGDMNSIYGRKNLQLGHEDVIKLVVKNKELELKRLYG